MILSCYNNILMLLSGCATSSGSYTATRGIPEVVHRISEFITSRDGGAPSHPENIYISPGSQWSLMVTAAVKEQLQYVSSSS